MTRKNAKYWYDFGGEYYSLKIWPNSLTPQHNRLVNLANESGKYRVFYCSPGFIRQSEYVDFYEKGEIAKNSIYVSCKDLPQISDDEKHDISYTIFPRRFIMHSDAFEIANGMDYDEFIKSAMDSEAYSSIEECVQELSDEFNINVSHYDSTQIKLRAIATHLFVQESIHLVLF